MNYFIGVSIVSVIIGVIYAITKYYLPIQTYHGFIIDKQSETWEAMSISNKVTSYTLVVQKNTFDTVKLTVLNSKKFEDLFVGDQGEFKARGNFLIDFNKGITSNQMH
ncbi:hypothetical protein [Paenibacillus sp. NPDC058174]|uniref:hypothetical protein n=1 Tax=Paenibacillus sp. NPDC058174 TaxID=3346366 RepID=UPI0036D8F6A7